MLISATINNLYNQHDITVQTDGNTKAVSIAPRANGYGSSVNGGEMLLLAVATCFCNDIYREAAKLNIVIDSIKVECTGNFGAEGEPGSNFKYQVHIESNAPKEEIDALIKHTDKVAEVHNTLRKGLDVTLV